MVRTFTDQELIAKLQSLPSFKGWPSGFIDLWVRSSADLFNLFDDKAYLFDCRSGQPVFKTVRVGTTNAGSYGLEHFSDYNVKGCAVLKSDEIVYDSHRHGLHHGKEAYVQQKPFPYYRDANRNERAEEIGVLYMDIIGANDHRAGQHSTVINNWSTACMVTADESDYIDDFLDVTNKIPTISLAILKEWPA
jgi:hypothetical protein